MTIEPRYANATRIVAAYLVLTSLPLALTAARNPGPATLAFCAIHGAILVALLVVPRRATSGMQAIGELLPLIAIPFLYAELPFLMAAFGGQYHDQLVLRWEAAVWDGQPAQALAAAMPTRWVSEPLHAAYLSYYAIIYAPLAWLWLRGPREGFRAAAAAVMATFAICFAVFVVFPVQGPRYLWPAPLDVPDGVIRSVVLAVLERGSSRGAAFPSSHMAVAVVQAVMAFRWHIPGAWLITVATGMLGIGAVYGGFHYATDMLAGAILGGLVAVVYVRPGVGPASSLESAPRSSARAVGRSRRHIAAASRTTREG